MLPEELLHDVERPARYIGAEHNIIRKDPGAVAVRVAMCYPDLYEVGMSHVGLHILYHVMNLRSDTYCERAFYPQADAADALRQGGQPLFALESGDPLSAFDVVGITLQHELTYTTVLGLLDLGRIPLLAEDRGDGDPIVLGGGPCAYNPEPVALFFDAFAIGDGEDVVNDILDVLASAKGESRLETLTRLAEVEGVYVPRLHDPAETHITKRVVQDLNLAPYPTRSIVPWVEIVHDRGQVEVARGCTRGCRFCQAGYVYRPVRERSPELLRTQARDIIGNTGYDEISLVSLNCPDYTSIRQLVDALDEDLGAQRVSVGLPSLRIDTFSVELAQSVQRVRKSGLTFAPEAGSQRLRDAINKGVTEEDLLTTVRAAFDAGWHQIKLYFMMGLPTETDADVYAIASLVKQVAKVGRETLGRRAPRMKINVSVSNLIPKPHTAMQWDGQISNDEMLRRQGLLVDAIRDRQVNLSFHDARQSTLEAALARGDRDTGRVILNAYQAGAIMDAWREKLNYSAWEEAFRSIGRTLPDEAAKQFALDVRLPWDHIDCGVDRDFLLAERESIHSGDRTEDCRTQGCHACGVMKMANCPLVTQEAPR